jgi:hypothetical protein
LRLEEEVGNNWSFDDPPFVAECVEKVDEAAKTTSRVRTATDLKAGKVTRSIYGFNISIRRRKFSDPSGT